MDNVPVVTLLVVLRCQLKVGLRVAAYWAFIESFRAFVYVTAVAALPPCGFFLFKQLARVQIY